MTPFEFLDRARRRPEVAVRRVVRVPGPELAARQHGRRPLPLSDFLAHPDQHREIRRFRFGNILGPGLSEASILEWQRRHSNAALPLDVIDLLRQVNGIHLWADLNHGRAYFGILPLAEWRDVREHEAAVLFDEFPSGTFVISYHDNGDYYLLLNTAEKSFTWFDPQSPSDSKHVGNSIESLLDWWWELTQELDPRKELGSSP